MKRRVITAIFILLALGLVATWLFVSPRLATQYLAPSFSCVCKHVVVLEFSEGKVRLHNPTHKLYQNFGSYEKIGNRTVWHLSEYKVDFQLKPRWFGVKVASNDFHQRMSQTFTRSLLWIDTSKDMPLPGPTTNYIKDLTIGFNRLPAN